MYTVHYIDINLYLQKKNRESHGHQRQPDETICALGRRIGLKIAINWPHPHRFIANPLAPLPPPITHTHTTPQSSLTSLPSIPASSPVSTWSVTPWDLSQLWGGLVSPNNDQHRVINHILSCITDTTNTSSPKCCGIHDLLILNCCSTHQLIPTSSVGKSSQSHYSKAVWPENDRPGLSSLSDTFLSAGGRSIDQNGTLTGTDGGVCVHAATNCCWKLSEGVYSWIVHVWAIDRAKDRKVHVGPGSAKCLSLSLSVYDPNFAWGLPLIKSREPNW